MNNVLHRKFVAYFYFVGWWAFSLGFHIDVASPNIEIHLPFGFIRVGWVNHRVYSQRELESEYINRRRFGLERDIF